MRSCTSEDMKKLFPNMIDLSRFASTSHAYEIAHVLRDAIPIDGRSGVAISMPDGDFLQLTRSVEPIPDDLVGLGRRQ